MRRATRFFNPIASILLTMAFGAVITSLVVGLIFKIALRDLQQIVIFGILLFVFLPGEVFALRVACWRFYKVSDTYVECGGFLRKKRRVFFREINNVRKEYIVVFHGTYNLVEEAYVLTANAIDVVIEINEETDALVDKLKKRGNLMASTKNGPKSDGEETDFVQR